MKLVNFNFKKIAGEKKPSFKMPFKPDTSITFIDVEKDEMELLKNVEVAKISFLYTLKYLSEDEKKKDDTYADIVIEGAILLSADKDDEFKELFKRWKKKEVDPLITEPLFNLILQRCLPRLLEMQEVLNLPLFVPPLKVRITENQDQ